MLILLPVEKWTVSGLGPTDVFIIGLIAISWPVFWRQRVRVSFPLALPMWIILLGSLVGLLSGLDFSAGFLALLQEIYLFVAFVTLVNAIVDRELFDFLKKVWIIVATVEAVLLVLQRFGFTLPFLRGGGKAAIAGTDVLTEIGRAVGTFVNTNAAGGYMLISFFLLLTIPYPRHRLLRAGLYMLFLAGIYSTGSNGALVGLIVGLSLTFLYWIAHHGRVMLFGLGVGAIVLTVFILSLPSIMSVLQSARGDDSLLVAFSRADDKLQKRLALWENGANLIEEYPLGIGPNVTRSVVVIALHNDYVAYLTERGPLGLLGLIMLLGEVLFWLALTARDGAEWRDHLATGALIGGLIGLALMSVVHEVTHGRAVWLFYAFIYLHYQFVRARVREGEPAFAVQSQPELITP